MKAVIPLLLCSWACIATGAAQQETHSIENGEGFDKRTQPYEAKAPYILKWQASKYAEHKTPLGETWRSANRGMEIVVCDAATRKILIKTGPQPLEGQIHVPVAGKHYLRIFTDGEWSTWYVVDAAAISAEQARKAAAARLIAQQESARQQRAAEFDPAPPATPARAAKPSSTPGLPAGMELGNDSVPPPAPAMLPPLLEKQSSTPGPPPGIERRR